MRLAFLMALGLSAGLFAGCNGQDTDTGKRQLNIVATTGMITDLINNVGGEHVNVHGLMGPGIDPHQHETTEEDRVQMERADVIFYNGLHLEGKMADVFEGLGTKAVAVTSRMKPGDLRPAPEGFKEGTHDPHVWFNVKLWIKAVDCVRETLIERDPANADVFRRNAAKYIAELEQLHAYVHAEAKKIPKERRVLVTAHDAFFYFGHEYDFEVHAVLGVSTVDEVSNADIERLVKLILGKRVPAIFPESSVSKKIIEAVKRPVEAQKFNVAIGEELFSDALGHPDDTHKQAGTYVGMVRWNIGAIVRALAPRGESQ